MLSPWLITPRCPSVSSSASNPNLVEKNAGKHEHHLKFPTLAPCAITKSKRTVDGASYEQQHPRPQTLTFTPTPLSPSPRFLPSIIVNLNSPLHAHPSPSTPTCQSLLHPHHVPSSSSRRPHVLARPVAPASLQALPALLLLLQILPPHAPLIPIILMHITPSDHTGTDDAETVLASLRATPHGAKILHMGARLAVGILGATAELERLCDGSEGGAGHGHVEEQREEEETVMDVEPDFYLSDPEEAEPDVELEMPPMLSTSWVVLGDSRMQSHSSAEQEWEMAK
ncbi:hypothetical protein FB45DRAFT_1064812 [Roridomyces roridus]|uniref:Uncharacterized protein n=1 Tax=Roridomyces roridus TaxID=1738132 RepID=A0AAD7B8C0_9AGAR|nr:hypothetical protein FB45DRAFT_1064812 [Roridomyces roridus]